MSLIESDGAKTKIIATIGDPTPQRRTFHPEQRNAKPCGTYGSCIWTFDNVFLSSLSLDHLIESFIRRGVDLIRMNMAHVDLYKVRSKFRAVKAALLRTEKRLASMLGDRHIGVLVDLPGPKIR